MGENIDEERIKVIGVYKYLESIVSKHSLCKVKVEGMAMAGARGISAWLTSEKPKGTQFRNNWQYWLNWYYCMEQRYSRQIGPVKERCKFRQFEVTIG